jgi:hypothetical protein
VGKRNLKKTAKNSKIMAITRRKLKLEQEIEF